MDRKSFILSCLGGGAISSVCFGKTQVDDNLIKLKDKKWGYIGDEWTCSGDHRIIDKATKKNGYGDSIQGANEETGELFCLERIEKYELDHVLFRFYIKKENFEFKYDGKYPDILVEKDDRPSLMKVVKSQRISRWPSFSSYINVKNHRITNECDEIKVYVCPPYEEAKIGKSEMEYYEFKVEYLKNSKLQLRVDKGVIS